MAPEPQKPGTRILSEEIRRAAKRRPVDLGGLMRQPGIGLTVLVWVAFAVVCTVLLNITREQPILSVGRVMNETAAVRVGFELEDRPATDEDRKSVRQQTPRVYVADTAVLMDIQGSLVNLPRTVSTAETIDDVAKEIREQFRLTPESLAALKSAVSEAGAPSEAWTMAVGRLVERLTWRPLLDQQTWQRETQSFNKMIELRVSTTDGLERRLVPSNEAVNIDDGAKLAETMRALIREAGFAAPVSSAVLSRLTVLPRPTYRFDQTATTARQNEAAAKVAPRMIKPAPGQVIFARGDRLTPNALELYRAEKSEYLARAERWQVWLPRLSVAGAVTAVTLALAGYAALFCPRIRRRPGRAAGVAGLLAGMLLVTCWLAAADPRLVIVAAVAPTVFATVLLVIAYDQRVALAFGCLQGVLVCIALEEPIGTYALIVTGIGVCVWMLKEVRDRSTLVKMGVVTGLTLAGGTIVVSLIDRPMTTASLEQTVRDAALAGSGGVLVSMLVLFILPWIERAFGVATSLTLIELRDPKQPLLRELQQRAPGTYNHSLNVASLGEAAAESIKANGLLAYVGALYHDVGKMNKPEYFVENQTPGLNKHDKLSPAMSLLVIVGHVKDGMELAREFNLPKGLHHFIEAHHGTTLVEYFFNRARKMAAGAPGGETQEPPQEIEYRYPGPKPRTKEVAITMLCDAVESAARSMPNPTPSRIEAIVRALATKRLMDGQFDDSDLTLRELNTIVEAVTRTLTSIYHGRIAYPDGVVPGVATGGGPGVAGPKTGDVRLQEADQPTRAGEAVGRAG
ncbi:MAG: HDIG domain-containing protein [Phycisphaeraceae bacterium]|nr:HDIG domain-containing protein [Phycisphaeraceae bacterium]